MRLAKGVEIGLVEVFISEMRVELVARDLGTAVNGEVLGRGDGLEVFSIVALHAVDEGERHFGG